MIKNKFCDQLHAEKYRGKNESHREAMNRIASALKDDDAHFHEFRDALLNLRFMPAGRPQAAMGSPRRVTAYNCFVMPAIEDSFTDGANCIMDVAKHAATTMRMGGGVGYDFSTIRPAGDTISKLGSKASGPVSFMHIFDAVCKATASAGDRRGAQMGVLRVDHPDIEEFVTAKQPSDDAEAIIEMMDQAEPGSAEWSKWNAILQSMLSLTGFNVSVAVTDEFMIAVEAGADFELKWGGRSYGTIDARALWEKIMRSSWDWAEPGVLFIDTINRTNNLHYCETLAATNPCGEQPLPQWGACLLGSFNLTKYLVPDPEGFSPYRFDYEQLRADIPPVVRAMDNVIDRTIYPLYEQEKEAKNKRRMGLGITGAANAFEAMGYPYGSAKFCQALGNVLAIIRDECYSTSADLAEEKGAFPMFDRARYSSGQFIKTLPGWLRAKIAEKGIRNSHLTSIAPTGTISLCADNVSSGIEPVFSYECDRTVRTNAGTETVTVRDWAAGELGIKGKTAADVTVEEHLDVLTTAQRFVDSSISKTCNVPPGTQWEEFKSIYMKAWKAGAKGCTTFTTGGRRYGILNAKKDDDEMATPDSCEIDLQTGRRSCE